MNKTLADIFQDCLKTGPSDRPSFEKILQELDNVHHPFKNGQKELKNDSHQAADNTFELQVFPTKTKEDSHSSETDSNSSESDSELKREEASSEEETSD